VYSESTKTTFISTKECYDTPSISRCSGDTKTKNVLHGKEYPTEEDYILYSKRYDMLRNRILEKIKATKSKGVNLAGSTVNFIHGTLIGCVTEYHNNEQTNNEVVNQFHV